MFLFTRRCERKLSQKRLKANTNNSNRSTSSVRTRCSFNFWVLRVQLLAVSYPNDMAMHTQMVTLARNVLSTGISPDQWYPYLSLGSLSSFSIRVSRQSSPVLLQADWGSCGLLWDAVPVAGALADLHLHLRASTWMGTRVAGVSAAMAPLLFSVTGDGFEAESYGWLGNGLWSELWAMWTLPFAGALAGVTSASDGTYSGLWRHWTDDRLSLPFGVFGA